MFSVIISEKGGAERRESFERTEINVGRVQGNDLTLPKGNVSKRHARLLFRDGRFIVTDLKSTNGTYVNGRKIAQATIVREGDKIYIGDFVLRIEAASASSPRHQGSATTGADSAPPPGPERVSEVPSSSSHPSSAEKSLAKAQSPKIESKSNDHAREIVSHFPLEQDPDDSVPYAVPGPPKVPSSPQPFLKVGASPSPAPPEAPAGGLVAEKTVGAGVRLVDRNALPPAVRDGAESTPMTPNPAPAGSQAVPYPGAPTPINFPRPMSPLLGITRQGGTPGAALPPDRPAPLSGTAPSLLLPPERPTAPSTMVAGPSAPSPSPAAPAGSSPAVRRALPAPERSTEEPSSAPHRAALALLVERTALQLDLSPLASGAPGDSALVARLERTLKERAAAMKAQGETPADVDLGALVAEARRELLELGPLTALLEEEDVREIQVVRHDYLVAVHGQQKVPLGLAFTSEEALGRIIRRLCLSAGRALGLDERFVERRLPQGGRMFAVLPQAAGQGHILVLRKPQRADLTLEDLVRSGTISRAIAGLLSQCVAARANILVTGAVGAGTTSLLAALAGAGAPDDRVIVLQEEDELILSEPHAVSILLGDSASENAQAVRAAARARPDRLVVGAFSGPLAAEVVDAMGDGTDGVLAASRAPTLRRAMARLTADLAATKPGLTPDTAREWLASAFDLALEIARLKDGRHRVLRVAELNVEGAHLAVKDIFTFVVERTAAGGAVEGTFHPTGQIPGIVEDLAARGVTVDLAIFKRHAEPTRPGRP